MGKRQRRRERERGDRKQPQQSRESFRVARDEFYNRGFVAITDERFMAEVKP